MSKVAIITGTSSGVGASLAVQLAAKGYKVYATMRNLDKKGGLVSLADDAGVTVHLKELDVQKPDTISKCVSEVLEADGKIDLLVNNAGAGFVKSTEQATMEEVSWVMDVNFMGVVRCTQAVLPHMRRAKAGHVINITSVGGLVGQPFNEFYCAAKFAVEGYTEAMASYIQPSFGVKFTAVEPGGIKSEFANSVLKQIEQTGGLQDDEYRPILNKYLAGAGQRTEGVYQTSDQVAEVIVQVAQNPDPPIRIRTSPWSEKFCELKTQADPDGKKLQRMVAEGFLKG